MPQATTMTDPQAPGLNDAHCHFFSAGFFTTLGRDPSAPPARDPAVDLPAALGWDPPGPPAALADRWVAELDRHGVTRAAIMASVPGDEPSVAEAAARHPARLTGTFMLNPIAPDASARVQQGFGEHGLRCACLFPAMHGFGLDDERVVSVFEAAAERRGAVFVHCGVLSVGVRRTLGLPSRFDIRRGNPLALVPVASAFPDVPVVVPHFGAGFFRETLMAADLCPNLHVDTSSSNAWTKYTPGLRLVDVFRQALAVLGPERMLFGSDSSFFPRGWQHAVLDAQRAALEELDLDAASQAAIFAGNSRAFFDSVETEKRGKTLFEKARPLREALDRNEKRSNRVFGGSASPPGGSLAQGRGRDAPVAAPGLGRDRSQTAPQQPNNRLLSAR